MSGAQRIHDVALLTERAEHWKVREGKGRILVFKSSNRQFSSSLITPHISFYLFLSSSYFSSLLFRFLSPQFRATLMLLNMVLCHMQEEESDLRGWSCFTLDLRTSERVPCSLETLADSVRRLIIMEQTNYIICMNR